MIEKLDPKEIVSIQELITTIVYSQEAIVNLLERKGILTKCEILDEIKNVRKETAKKGTVH